MGKEGKISLAKKYFWKNIPFQEEEKATSKVQKILL